MITYCFPLDSDGFGPFCTATREVSSREEAGTTGAIVDEKRVCWFGMSDGTMYRGVLVPGYGSRVSPSPTAAACRSE